MVYRFKRIVFYCLSLTLSAALLAGCTEVSPTSTPESSGLTEETSILESSEEPEETLPAGNLSDWNLILLNPEAENKIDEDLPLSFETFDGQKIDERIAESYRQMVADAEADGVHLFLRSGYRPVSLQKTYYESNIQKYMQQGMTREEAEEKTREYYTEPGHSEHHSGLALDILTEEYQRDVYTLDDRFAQTDGYAWLVEHCTDYGFILRYPEDKTEITQINYEPWHYRYVGKEHAAYMKEHGLCLEEYINLLCEAGR